MCDFFRISAKIPRPSFKDLQEFDRMSGSVALINGKREYTWLSKL